jgi:hypothetical protein
MDLEGDDVAETCCTHCRDELCIQYFGTKDERHGELRHRSMYNIKANFIELSGWMWTAFILALLNTVLNVRIP